MSFWKRLIVNIILYLIFLAIPLMGVPYAKELITGAVGVRTDLFGLYVIAPIVFLWLGWWLGSRSLFIHLACFSIHLVLSFYFDFTAHLSEAKDFTISMASSWFVCVILACLARTVFVKKLVKE